MNVRWDSVVDCHRQVEPDGLPIAQGGSAGSARSGERIIVKVWLYGTLARDGIERPVELELGGDLTVAAVIPELERRFGEGFRHQVIDTDGRKFSHCLVFVDGVKVDNLDTLVHRGTASVQVEMILLTVTEGG